jgi:hypothetical protein
LKSLLGVSKGQYGETVLNHAYIQCIRRYPMTTAGQAMTLHHNLNAVHAPFRMPLDKSELA